MTAKRGNKKGDKMRNPDKSTTTQFVITAADKTVLFPYKQAYEVHCYNAFVSQAEIIRYVFDLGLTELEKQTAILQEQNKAKADATL